MKTALQLELKLPWLEQGQGHSRTEEQTAQSGTFRDSRKHKPDELSICVLMNETAPFLLKHSLIPKCLTKSEWKKNSKMLFTKGV